MQRLYKVGKFRAGDRVRIVGASKNIENMKKLIGKIDTVRFEFGSTDTYELTDNPEYIWRSEWLTPLDFDAEYRCIHTGPNKLFSITDEEFASLLNN